MKTIHIYKRFGLKFIVFFFLVILILSPMIVFSAGMRPGPTEKAGAAWPWEISDLAPDPALMYGRLENGFSYILLPNRKPENRVSAHLFVSAGSFQETEAQRGVAHFLEHIEFCGSTHFKPGELVEYFQRIGMKFGADANAQTGFLSTVYDLDLPGGDEKSLTEGLVVIRDYAAGALILQSEVDRERHVILAEKRTRDSVGYRTFVSVLKFELPGTRIPRRLPIGDETVIKTAGRDLLKSYYDTWYRPERQTLVMVGDFDPKIALSLIKARFSNISPRAPEKMDPEPGNFSHRGFVPFYHYDKDAGDASVSIEVVTHEPPPADTAAFEKNRLLSGMANRIIGQRLDEMTNLPDCPFTRAYIDSGYYMKFIYNADIGADCPPGKWKATLEKLEQTLRRALEYGFTGPEVKRVKKEMAAAFDRAVKSAKTRESSTLARHIISSLSNDRVFMSPEQRMKLLGPVVGSATPQTLLEALRNDWKPSHRLILVTGNADLNSPGSTPEKKIFSVFKKSQAMPVSRIESTATPVFPYLTPPEKPGKIRSKETIDGLGITRVVFENNIVLYVKKTDFSENRVTAMLSFGPGSSAQPADQPGLSMMAQKVVNLSGLGKMDMDTLKKALAGTSTGVSFRIDDDKFVFSGQSISKEIPLLFELMYAHIKDPGFRKRAWLRANKEATQTYENLSHAIHGAIPLHVSRFFAGGDSRFGMPVPDEFKDISLEDIRSWVGNYILTAPMELAVVGDLDEDEVINQASILLGSLPVRKPVEGGFSPQKGPVFPRGGNAEFKVPTPVNKGLLVVAFPTTDIWDIHKTRRLSILSEIFTDRMRSYIRVKLGATYSPYAYNSPSRGFTGYGLFQAMITINPDDVKKVRDAVFSIASDLRANGVTEDELTRAKKPVLTGIREALETNGYWLGTVLAGAARHPEQIDWSRTILKDYKSITSGEIDAVIKKYLVIKDAATVVVGPEKDG
ncbi:MAG: insulinase family protein [Deltaproteobacteria bacterium]|nr:insulinase family protein [Deltaproteobacteria bacterium]